jgi:hypothetical protein
MLLPQRFNVIQPQGWTNNAGGANNATLLGTTLKTALPRTFPLEDIWIRVNFTVNTGGLTLVASPTTPDQYDNILQLAQHINLQVNNGIQPRSTVDCSGVALLEYLEHEQCNIDLGTQAMMIASQTGSLPAGNYTIMYRIPCVDDSIGEPLRSRLYLPIHTYPQDPILSVTIQNAATMYSAGNINALYVDVLLIGRQVTPQSEAVLQKTACTNPNGYIDWDLIETPFVIPVGSAAQIRIAIPLPGSYCNLLFRHYLGGATITRKEVDNGATGSSFGNENLWDIETAANAIRQWRWQHLRSLSEASQTKTLQGSNLFGSTASGSYTGGTLIGTLQNLVLPFAGGSIPAGQGMRYANSCFLDFLTDGKSEDVARELGSVLDCNTPANTGLKMEIVGTPTNVSTNSSQLNIFGRRIFGDISDWQQFA